MSKQCDKIILTEEVISKKFFFFKKIHKINYLLIDGERLTYKNINKFKFKVVKDKPFYFRYYRANLYNDGVSVYTHLLECYLTNLSFRIGNNNSINPVIKYKQYIYYLFNGKKNIKETNDKELYLFLPEILDYIEIYKKNEYIDEENENNVEE